MLKFEKDGGVKLVEDNSDLIEILEANGWELISESTVVEELTKKVSKKKSKEPKEGFID